MDLPAHILSAADKVSKEFLKCVSQTLCVQHEQYYPLPTISKDTHSKAANHHNLSRPSRLYYAIMPMMKSFCKKNVIKVK